MDRAWIGTFSRTISNAKRRTTKLTSRIRLKTCGKVIFVMPIQRRTALRQSLCISVNERSNRCKKKRSTTLDYNSLIWVCGQNAEKLCCDRIVRYTCILEPGNCVDGLCTNCGESIH